VRGSPRAAALAGVVAAGLALAVVELVGSFGPAGRPTVLTAIGNRSIRWFAGPLKGPAIRWFGTSDKTVLLVGIVLVCLLLGGVAGWAERWRPPLGGLVFVAFAVVGLVIELDDPLTAKAQLGVALVVGTAVGLAALHLLVARVPGPAHPARSTLAVPVADPRVKQPSRRQFLAAVGLASAGAGTAAGLAAGLRRSRDDGIPVGVLPGAVAGADAGTGTGDPSGGGDALDPETPFLTPNGDFYRIDTALVVPRPGLTNWRLKVTGMVARPFELTYDELLALDLVEEVVTLVCVSNGIGGDLVGNARWRGVPLAALLERAGPDPTADQVVGRSVDGYTAGFPTGVALDGRTALVVVGMNGAPLPAAHGFPARLVVAGLYGYVSATKWLQEIELTRRGDVDGFWVTRGFAKDAPVRTQSRIDLPRSGGTIPAGRLTIAGVAWAPTRGIQRVEVRVDDEPWWEATVARVASDETWVQWATTWDAVPGHHRLWARATDGTGAVQDERERPTNPDGATGWPSRTVRVV
jgi:DMSO/TMAO reductase YedYZ molybdopterin-dependent catalytic subunit